MTQAIAHVNPDELPHLTWQDGWQAVDPPSPINIGFWPPPNAARCQACALTDNHHIRRCLLPTGHAGPHLGQP